MHHSNAYINGHLESKRPDFVWAVWVPNIFPFGNLALEYRFWFVENALSFSFLDCNLEIKSCNFPFLDCNLGNIAL